jgi:5S rRNA maturation endonuclease (ribonuclease M5)
VAGKGEVAANYPGSHTSSQILHKRGVEIIKSTKKKLTTLRGIVIPVEWDEKGMAIAVALSTHTEDEYLIDPNYMGKELLRYIQEDVEVSGMAKENKDKKTKVITVQKYILKRS